MGLFSVLGTSSAGLKSVQDSLSLVSQNVAGANTPGYVRRTQAAEVTSAGGVMSGSVQRLIDQFVQKAYWQSKTDHNYSRQLSSALTDVNQVFGKPGSDSGLASLLSKFQSALQNLNADPTSGAQQQTVIGQARLLINAIHAVSSGIQTARSNSETGISNDVAALDGYLVQIDKLNKKISNAGREADPSLLDQRDALIGNVSNLIGIKVNMQADGTVKLLTDTGFSLVDQAGAAHLTFDSHGDLQATDHYQIDAIKRKTGTITATSPSGTTVDLLASGLVKSGEIGAYVSLRDDILVTAQSQIDDFASALAATFSDYTVAGNPITNGQSINISGLNSGNRIHFAFKDSSGKEHKIAFVGVTDAGYLPLQSSATMSDGEQVFGFDVTQSPVNIASAMQTALNAIGGGITVAPGAGSILNFTGTAPAVVTTLSATMTSTAFGAGVKGLPLFVDGTTNTPFTDSYDGASQRTGFASRISLNSLISNTPSLLVSWGATGSASAISRTDELVTRITTGKSASSSTSELGLPETGVTITGLLTQIIQTQSIATSSATSISSNAKTAMNYAEQKFNAVSGVSIDNELASMTALQSAYAANARVMTAAREMLDALMRI